MYRNARQVGQASGAARSAVIPAAPTITGGYETRNLVGNNNAGTPNTKFDFSADLVVLRNTSDGSVVVRTNTGTLTCDFAGVGANGLDAGVQAANTWYHFYFIWNGTTLASLGSLVAPVTGPTLPSGYTHWAYAGAVRSGGATTFLKTRFRGCWMWYQDRSVTNVLANGTATVETTISCSSFVPPNALLFKIQCAANAAQTLHLRYVSGVDIYLPQFSPPAYPITFAEFPNLSQQFFYLWGAAPGSGLSADVIAFSVPNGGE